MRLTSEPQEWTPIDPNLENELLNVYARIEELEIEARYKDRLLRINKETNNHIRDLMRSQGQESITFKINLGDDKAVSDQLRQQMYAIARKCIIDQQRPGGLLRND